MAATEWYKDETGWHQVTGLTVYIGGGKYIPDIYNDVGIYSYFYIDFGQALESFSKGMLTESIFAYAPSQLPITDYNYVSPGLYKIYCDITGKTRGVTIVNTDTSLLAFSTGEKIPVFAQTFYVDDLVNYRIRDVYQGVPLSIRQIGTPNETINLDLIDPIEILFPLESLTVPPPKTITETINSVVLV